MDAPLSPRYGQFTVVLASVDKHRPCLVVSGETANLARADLTLAPVTTLKGAHGPPGWVLLRKGDGGLPSDSFVRFDLENVP